jgi:hypothetical protein
MVLLSAQGVKAIRGGGVVVEDGSVLDIEHKSQPQLRPRRPVLEKTQKAAEGNLPLGTRGDASKFSRT